MLPKLSAALSNPDRIMSHLGNALSVAHKADIPMKLRTAVIRNLQKLMDQTDWLDLDKELFRRRYAEILEWVSERLNQTESGPASSMPMNLSPDEIREQYLGKFARISFPKKPSVECRIIYTDTQRIFLCTDCFWIGMPLLSKDTYAYEHKNFLHYLRSGKIEILQNLSPKKGPSVIKAKAEYPENFDKEFPCATIRQIMNSVHTGKILAIFNKVQRKSYTIHDLLENDKARKQVWDFVEERLVLHLTPVHARELSLYSTDINPVLSQRNNDISENVNGDAWLDHPFSVSVH